MFVNLVKGVWARKLFLERLKRSEKAFVDAEYVLILAVLFDLWFRYIFDVVGRLLFLLRLLFDVFNILISENKDFSECPRLNIFADCALLIEFLLFFSIMLKC